MYKGEKGDQILFDSATCLLTKMLFWGPPVREEGKTDTKMNLGIKWILSPYFLPASFVGKSWFCAESQKTALWWPDGCRGRGVWGTAVAAVASCF